MSRQHKAAVWLPAVLLLVAMLLQAAGPAQAVLPGSSSDSVSPATSAAAAKQRKPSLPNNHLWIVQLKDAAAVAYSGDIPGLAATMAQPPESAAASVSSNQASTSSSSSSSRSDAIGRRPRFAATSAAAVQYASYISAQSEAAVARALGPSSSAKIVHRYSTVLAGFTIGPLSSSEVHALRQDPNVASVTRDGRGYIKTISTPAFLGLSSPSGAWSKVGGWSKSGEGIIIGMVDTGYWPEGPSFSDLEFPNNRSGKLAFGPPPDKFSGICMPGDTFPADTCNNKVIGCRYFLDGVGGRQRVKQLWPTESISCRATDGGSVTHGSHTGSTAAGNHGIVSDNPSYKGSMSGMAPAARLAIYKASWGSDDGGYASDFVAAVEQATKDGVDVINYSMGAAAELSFSTPVETAFRHAAAAGVFVSAACGNTGPGPYTIVDTWGPWIMSVGASTFSRSYTARAAAAAAAAGAEASAAADPNDAAAAAALKDGLLPQQETSPTMAYFTSRGPIVAGDGNLLKPDITAPGVSVVAQVPNFNGYTARSLSGTSMSAPHISGIAAVVMSKYPTWSPMAVKSAIMTTAYQTTRTGPPPDQKQVFGGPFDFGAGHVDATLALDPGLIIDSGAPDWQRFMCGISEVPYSTWSQHAECRPCHVALADASCVPSKYESMTPAQVSRCVACDPSNFNTPSIAMSMLAGPKYVTRTVTNVKATSATYTAVIEAPAGFKVTLRPRSFTAAAGASTTVRIRIQKSSANTPYSVWQPGAITWVGSGGTRTRIPLVVRAVQLASRPTEVKLKAWQGSYSYLVEPEWNGVLATANTGLLPSKVYSGTVEVSEYSHRLQVVLPPGVWSYVRFATFNDDVSGWNGVLPDFSSINLQVFKPGGSSAGISANDYNSDEQVNLENARGGTYTVQITADTEEAISFKVHVWALNFTAATSASTATHTSSPGAAAPAKAASGGPLKVDLSFAKSLADGRAAGQRYLGAVVYSRQPGGVFRRLQKVKTLVSLV